VTHKSSHRACRARGRLSFVAAKRWIASETVEAPDQREAYRLAIEKFNVPVERQNRLFVRRL
jgi:hypothetical protein